MNKILVLSLIFLSGCTTYKEMVYVKDLQINNYAPNNFVGNPCELWLNDRCLIVKPNARNLDSPLKESSK